VFRKIAFSLIDTVQSLKLHQERQQSFVTYSDNQQVGSQLYRSSVDAQSHSYTHIMKSSTVGCSYRSWMIGAFLLLLLGSLAQHLRSRSINLFEDTPAAKTDIDSKEAENTDERTVHILKVDWDGLYTSSYTSKTIATLQVVSNPVLNSQTSPIASTLFRNLHELNADLVRYAAWFPYPIMGVAELEPPNVTSKTTSWNFTEELQQMFLDTFRAVVSTKTTQSSRTMSTTVTSTSVRREGGTMQGFYPNPLIGPSQNTHPWNRLLISFSTQPAWMFNTSNWSYDPMNPNKAIWSYASGKWTNRTTTLVGDYYGRFASWLVNGSLEDEFGNVVSGGPALGLGPGGVTHWEVFNEPDSEHDLSWFEYNQLYDAVVRSIRYMSDPDHQITFVGMALAQHYEWDWYEGFLNLDNHAPDVRDAVANGMISFHWYGNIKSRTDISHFDQPFSDLQHFLDTEIDGIIERRDRLSSTTKLFLNEGGVIPLGDNDPNAEPLPPIYFNMAAGVFTVLVSELSIRGVDAVGSSQFCGCPAIPEWDIPDRQYPGVSMTNWTTGNGNPRYWALKLYLEFFGPGDEIIPKESCILTTTADGTAQRRGTGQNRKADDPIFAQARLTERGKRYALILVNKTAQRQTVKLNVSADFTKANVNVIDQSTHDEKWREFTVPLSGCCSHKHDVVLEPFAVAIVELIRSSQEAIDSSLSS
jgi:hypothetical protein